MNGVSFLTVMQTQGYFECMNNMEMEVYLTLQKNPCNTFTVINDIVL